MNTSTSITNSSNSKNNTTIYRSNKTHISNNSNLKYVDCNKLTISMCCRMSN